VRVNHGGAHITMLQEFLDAASIDQGDLGSDEAAQQCAAAAWKIKCQAKATERAALSSTVMPQKFYA